MSLRRRAMSEYASDFHKGWPVRVRCIADYVYRGPLFNLTPELAQDPAYLAFVKAKHPKAPFMELPRLADQKETIEAYRGTLVPSVSVTTVPVVVSQEVK